MRPVLFSRSRIVYCNLVRLILFVLFSRIQAVQAMKALERIKMWLHAYLTSASEGDKLQFSPPGWFTLTEKASVPIEKEMDEKHNPSLCYEKDKQVLPPLGIEIPLLDLPTHILLRIPTELSRLLCVAEHTLITCEVQTLHLRSAAACILNKVLEQRKACSRTDKEC